MKYVRLGHTGLQVSRICLGCMSFGNPNAGTHPWTLPEAESRPILKAAWEAGINFFDTANVYSAGTSEEIVGKILKELAPRDELVIATKVHGEMRKGPNGKGQSRKAIMNEIDASLKRLGTDYVDLYQIHRFDPHTPIEETLDALNDVVRAGKALYLGASSMFAWQFGRMLATSDRRGLTRFATMQNHYNLVYREEEREMIPLCRAEGIGLLPWSPLARGFLAGNRRTQDFGDTSRARTDALAQQYYYQPSDFAVVEAVSRVATRRGVSNAQIALAWVLAQPGVTAPIIGASKLPQLAEAVAAVDLVLSNDEIAELTAPYLPHPVLGHQ